MKDETRMKQIQKMTRENLEKRLLQAEKQIAFQENKLKEAKEKQDLTQLELKHKYTQYEQLTNQIAFQCATRISLEIEHMIPNCDTCEYNPGEYGDTWDCETNEYCDYSKESLVVRCVSYKINSGTVTYEELPTKILWYMDTRGEEKEIRGVTYIRNVDSGRVLYESEENNGK